MKMLTLAAAAAAAFLAVPAASAAAAPSTAAPALVQDHHDRQMERRVERRVERRMHHRRGWERRHAAWRTTCTRQWRHGHRVRVCRKVRYWR